MREREDVEDVWLKMAELLQEHDDKKIVSGLKEITRELYPEDDCDKTYVTNGDKDE